MPKVSVIMPTFNRKAYLKAAIESVLLQKIDDFEIIITDNASTDGTDELVASFTNESIRYFRNEKNIGVVNNYNKALELASGEYVYIFSDDDIMLQDNILKKVKILDAYSNVSLVHSNIKIINEIGQITSGKHWAGSYYDKWNECHCSDLLSSGKKYFEILYNHWNIISMPSVLVRRSVLNKVGVLNTKTHYFCDWDLWMRICLFSDVYYLSETLLDYRIHASNTISEINHEIKTNELVLIKKILFSEYASKLHEIGLSENNIEESVAKQIAKYPMANSSHAADIKSYSLLSRIKNKFFKFLFS